MRRFLLPPFICGIAVAAHLDAQTVTSRTLARAESEFQEPFSDVTSVRELRDGRVIVVDGRELTVQVIDLRSGSATPIGRTGDGPGEYRWPGRLFRLPGDSSLLFDQAGGRILILGPDARPGAFYDPNRSPADSVRQRLFRFFLRFSDDAGRLYSEAQPIRIGADGNPALVDSAAIERLDRRTGRRDTVVFRPLRRDANARLMPGGLGVVTQPVNRAFPAFDHWTVSPDGRIALIYHEPYRVDYVMADGSTVKGQPIPYTRVRVDDALKAQYKEERQRPVMALVGSRGGGSGMQVIRPPYREPAEWPEYLPPYMGSAVFSPDGMLWVPRALAAGSPPTYDVIDGNGRLVERIVLNKRSKLIGFGQGTVYIVRMDEDDLQYLQRHRLPSVSRP